MTAIERARLTDSVRALLSRCRIHDDEVRFSGFVTVELFGPDGELKAYEEGPNLITRIGDQVYGERGAGLAGALAAPTGMKLGTGATAVAKSGAGSALTTYLATSNKAFDATYPLSALSGSSRRITYRRTYAAGEATSAGAIQEAVIVNDTIATDATAAEANTLSRFLITTVPSKAAADSLVVTWNHDLLGA